jgi:serine/threonine protein kinase
MPVAIKMLKHKLAMDSRFLDRFQGEARTIAGLNHENIVKVYDIESRYQTVFIVMEYVEGETLEAILQETPRLPMTEVLRIVLQICTGLSYAHGRGIVHRDIKPANIIVQRDGKSKILDFGLAGAPGSSDPRRFEGTPMYASPERVKCENVDTRSDIYSLGLTCFRMFTGREAFPDDDVNSLLKRQIHEALPDPRSLVPDLPDEIVKFLTLATRKDPAERYQYVDQVIAEILPMSQRLGVSISSRPLHDSHLRNLLLFYGDQHREVVDRLVEEFSQELAKIGVIFREADFKENS